MLTSPTGARFPPHRCSPRYQARSADCPSRPALRRIRFLAPGQAGLPSTRLRSPSGACLGPWARQQPHRAPPHTGRGWFFFFYRGEARRPCRADGVPRPPSSQRYKTLQLSEPLLPVCPTNAVVHHSEPPETAFVLYRLRGGFLRARYGIDWRCEGPVLKVLTSSSSSTNPGVCRCRNDCERPSLPRRSSTFRSESWPKANAKVAPIAVTYPARPAADRHRITMYVGSVFDRRLEAVSASSHRRPVSYTHLTLPTNREV